MTKKLVKEYYSTQTRAEWRRLVRDPYHRLEFETTMHFLRKYLPGKGLVLDAGGGPGRYTIELAKSGYDVVLFDLTPELLATARRRIRKEKVQDGIKEVIQGSIDDLSMFEDETFDAVICLGGTLSHLVNRDQREKAFDELIRVAKGKAPIFMSVIGRLALMVAGLVLLPEELRIKNLYEGILETGDYRGGYGFAPCHFYLPDELESTVGKRKVEVLEMVGLEGLASHHPKETNRLFGKHPDGWKTWQRIHLRSCTHPSVVAISEHFMIICRKE